MTRDCSCDWDGFWRPFLITLASGLATTIGAGLVFFIDARDEKKLSTFLALSGGVMTYLCFSEMLPASLDGLKDHFSGNNKHAKMVQSVSFFGAILLCVFCDFVSSHFFVKNGETSSRQLSLSLSKEASSLETGEALDTAEATPAEAGLESSPRRLRELRLVSMALMAAGAVTVHNIPEGVSTFYSNAADKSFGVAMAVAMGIHNIPEGVAVALPVLKASNSRMKAFVLASLSGLAQPAAALLGYLALGSRLSLLTEGVLYSVISGVMIFIALASLYPVALEYSSTRGSAFFLLGMASMGLADIFIES